MTLDDVHQQRSGQYIVLLLQNLTYGGREKQP